MLLAEIILPLATRSNFTYKIKTEQEAFIKNGIRVQVPFGKNKIYTGIVKNSWNVTDTEEYDKYKWVEEVIDEHPIFFDTQFKLLEWVAYYYMSTEGEVLKAALPIGLKPKSKLYIRTTEDTPSLEETITTDKEYLLLEALENTVELSVEEVSEIWNIQGPMPHLRKMEEKGWIALIERVEETYAPKTKSYVSIHPHYQNESKLNETLDTLSRKAPQQENVLMHVITSFLQGNTIGKSELAKMPNVSTQAIAALIEKGILKEEHLAIDRLPETHHQPTVAATTLNPMQEVAYQEMMTSFREQISRPVLLHGVTGSGKTHIYIHLIKEVVKKGKQVLYLLPEISITQQIIDRLRRELGSRIGIYHSRFNDNERVEIWQKICNKQYDVVVGVRSAVFLPFENLGLIIVDEEHERSFKQEEPAPRYHARDVAIWLSHHLQCPILLGSATPSFESFQHTRTGKYTLVSLTKRAIALHLPEIEVVDMKQETKEKKVKGIFSSVLLDKMSQALSRKEQIILFQNRRGYSPYLICTQCGFVPECINCDISLTYHKHKDYARCHYCGHTEYLNDKCPSCFNYTLKRQGAGTERIEEEVKMHFPEAIVERMDLDTTRGKTKFQRLINRLEAREIDILVGTQMVSKGLDFENVTLVGVMNADNLLAYPEFRVFEHAYQMLTQVSGRAGRSIHKGHVVIQTMQPQNPVLQFLQRPYQEFFDFTLPQRQELGYPPFHRLIRIEVHHHQPAFIETESMRLNMILKPIFGDALIGPDYAMIPRVRNIYRMQFLLKLSKQYSLQKVREALHKTFEAYYKEAPAKTLRILVNVDP